MQNISTTHLRTESPRLIKTLLSGKKVTLIHRSKIVGEITPKIKGAGTLSSKDVSEITAIAKKITLPKLSDGEIKRRYRKALLEKYGKGISRH